MKYKKVIAILLFVMLGLVGCRQANSDEIQDNREDKLQVIQSSKKEIYADSEKIAECYRKVYEQAFDNKHLATLEVKQKIISCLGNAGYSAVDSNNQIDMVHPEQVEKFCEQVENKQKAELTILDVLDNGAFIRYDFQTKNGSVNVGRSALYWHNDTPKAEYYEEYTPYTWVYSPKGYLFFEQYQSPGFYGPSGHIAIRVKPLDEKCRELNRKYLLPIGYNLNNIFITDWTEEDYNNLNFYDLYDILYLMKYKTYVPYESDCRGTIYEIPKEEFEGVIKEYFSIESRVLQKKTTYYADKSTYQYRPRGLNDCASTTNIPYPEVVDYEENADGTMKLMADVVWVEKNLECAFSHEVVIRPLRNGDFQYVSNHVIPSEDNVKPIWYTERLTAKEWEKYYKENK